MALYGFHDLFLSNLIWVQTFFFTIAADYMPLQPIEDQDDTVINFLYPLEPPVRFHLWVCFVEQYYLNIKNCFFIYRSYIICYIS